MAILRVGDIKDLGYEDMVAKRDELRFELAREKALLATGSAPDNPGRIRELKRTIARINTILVQKEKE
ncbi:MAG: 50S ribosomal protein L29 [Candidatus Methanofastidiosa archaeon]|jgi:large subunit ribosomal protein L29|nr:50S ribosomal protein L29 [Candidatus Methanofastidiosa archaeon]